MIKITKYFTDVHDNFKPYNVDDECDFGRQRNDYLVENGYAVYLKQTKVLDPETGKKPANNNEPKIPENKLVKNSSPKSKAKK